HPKPSTLGGAAMRSVKGLVGAGSLLALFVLPAGRLPAHEVPAKHRVTIDKGLAWLVRQQHRDGHWEGTGGEVPMPVTAPGALAGLALRSEGSTLREGKSRDNLRRAVDWVVDNARVSGLLTARDLRTDDRHIFGHGYAMLFLACAVGDLEDGPQRRRVLRILE